LQRLLLFSGYIFPALIAALVPVRSYIVSRLFTEEDVLYLDPMAETQQDFSEKEVMEDDNDNDDDEQQHLVGEDNAVHVPTDIGEDYAEA
jgi:hypothetical protein